jgi:hypothetical protein
MVIQKVSGWPMIGAVPPLFWRCLGVDGPAGCPQRPSNKSFLLLFFKKEGLAFFPSLLFARFPSYIERPFNNRR